MEHHDHPILEPPQPLWPKNKFIPRVQYGAPSFPWAGDRLGTVRSLNDLRSHAIDIVTGEVKCTNCSAQVIKSCNIRSEFVKVMGHIESGVPAEWMTPSYAPNCSACGEAMVPVIPSTCRVNWLFLFFTQTLGLCTLEQLKFFCKFNYEYGPSTKDGLLYLTYLTLCKQLDPAFNIWPLILPSRKESDKEEEGHEGRKLIDGRVETDKHKKGKVDSDIPENIHQQNLVLHLAELKDNLGRSIADACTEGDTGEEVKDHHSNGDHQSASKSNQRTKDGDEKPNDDANDVSRPSKRHSEHSTK